MSSGSVGVSGWRTGHSQGMRVVPGGGSPHPKREEGRKSVIFGRWCAEKKKMGYLPLVEGGGKARRVSPRMGEKGGEVHLAFVGERSSERGFTGQILAGEKEVSRRLREKNGGTTSPKKTKRLGRCLSSRGRRKGRVVADPHERAKGEIGPVSRF